MSEWNRRDREQDRSRYGYGDQERRGSEGGDRARGWRDDDNRSFAGRSSGFEDDYPGAGRQSYGGSTHGAQDRGSYGQGGQRSYGQSGSRGGGYGESVYGGERYGGPYGQGGSYDSGQRSGGAYGERGYGHEGPSYGGGGQGSGEFGQNERLQRVSDGEADRGHFFGGGMNRGGEHRGRGPKNYTRSDERIREDVNDRLSDDSWLDASEIDVQVASGEVTLTGTVTSRDDKRRAEDLAEQVSGVKHVQNSLRVQAASTGTSTNAGTSGGSTMTGQQGAAGATGRSSGGLQ